MRSILWQFTAVLCFICTLPVPAAAAQLDDYYLAAFGEVHVQPSGSALQKAVLYRTAETVGRPHCGMPIKRSLLRDWNKLETTTQVILAKQLSAPTLSGSQLTLNSPSGRFRIHYTTSGSDAVPSFSWVQTIARTFDDVASSFYALGWRLAPTSNGSPYEVYVRDLAPLNFYGQTTSTLPVAGVSSSFTSYIEIDNDYFDSVYQNALSGSQSDTQKALLSLQITATHEYHHAIQYGYNYYFDTWYAEATATWFEDELYDNANHLYNYIPGWFNNSTNSLDLTVDSTATSNGA